MTALDWQEPERVTGWLATCDAIRDGLDEGRVVVIMPAGMTDDNLPDVAMRLLGITGDFGLSVIYRAPKEPTDATT